MVSAVLPNTAHGGRAVLINSQEWVRQYNGGPSSSFNRGQAVAVRPDGSVVVAGTSSTPAADDDFLTLAYAADGTPLWTNRYDGPLHSDDSAQFIATAAAGDVWVAGHSGNPTLYSAAGTDCSRSSLGARWSYCAG